MKPVKFKPLVYPAKVIIAWAEAIKGNAKIRDWLAHNGYPELYTFIYALHLKEEARDWLIKNKFPHLLALIQGVERNEQALRWLQESNFTLLYHIALAADGENSSMNWLLKNERDFAMVAFNIQLVKNEIQTDHDDPHKIS